MKNYYKILEIEPTATQEQIRSQYHFLAHAWHPDKFPNLEQKAKAEERLREINEAFSIVSDPIKRADYDSLLNPRPSPPSQPVYTWTTRTTEPEKPKPVTPKYVCESCGLSCDTKYVEFYENVGLVYIRYHRSAKGNFCQPCIDYYFWNFTGKTMLLGWWGVISFILTPFILLNNFGRFISSRGMQRPRIQIAPNPSAFWTLSTIGGFLFIGFILFSMFFPMIVQPSNSSSMVIYPTKTPAIRATQPSKVPTKRPTQRPTQRSTARPTNPPKQIISYNGITCESWNSINKSDLGAVTCIYGKIYDYGPEPDNWNFIQFSSSSSAFRVVDFNFYYWEPLNIGDCVVVYGKIRDNGSYIMITPDKDASDSIQVGSASYCDIP
ncbi:MAG TPA: DnaJ domain-containing protein [Anaerolineales bacterium]|nr:DnaJ domain-containing protein [Anaerolineales bacterium]